MKCSLQLFLPLLFFCGMALAVESKNMQSMILNSGWRFHELGTMDWHAAQVPGCVHTDLLNNGLIPDPYYRTNEQDVQWIGLRDWEYMTTFRVSKALLQHNHLEMIFEGLDTYATVYLNDMQILKSDNMFRTWRVDVKSFLKKGDNQVRIQFHSVYQENLLKWELAPFRLKAYSNNDQADLQINMYSRKAGFHYGWDWGPRFITCGVWRPVRLDAWDDAHLENLNIVQKHLDDDKAELAAEFEVRSDCDQKATFAVLLDGNKMVEKEVALQPGVQQIKIDFIINQPQRWWSNGLGKAHLYKISGLMKMNSQTLQQIEHRIGLRTVRVVREKDAYGRSFYIELNGVPVFMKGANYIPQDNFQNRVTPARFEHMICSAAAANMNMLRIWGGGIYQDDLFYDLCDEYGILIWQEMMFACGMYPADEKFLANVREEVQQNAKRLRHHPCLALYCGNNENDISWYVWGWKKEYTPEVHKQYEADLHKLFREVILSALQEVDPERYYHPTSPLAGFNDVSFDEGDIHYWGVWHGKEPFSNFEKNLARFVSEYGFQSYPGMATIESFTLPVDRELYSPVMLSHQRCMADNRRDKEYGNRLIQTYMEHDYRLPQNFADYVYLSQVLQAEGGKMAIEIHRRNMPRCMGSLYWQIDDCWPVASWSSIDYFGRWKALHYFAKKAFQPVLISPVVHGDSLEIHIVSDQLTPVVAALELTAKDFTGKVIYEKTVPVNVAANTASVVYRAATVEWVAGHSPQDVLLKAVLRSGESILADAICYFTPVKELNLPQIKVTCESVKTAQGYRLRLNSASLAKNVYLVSDDADAFFSDNYFDLLPGEPVEIEYLAKNPAIELPQALHIRSLRDTY